MSGCAKCPATMCPYMDAEDGSPWTGEQDSECEGDECGWFMDSRCIIPGEVGHDIYEAHDGEFVMGDIPPCPKSDECKWQEQSGDNPCPPRLAVMMGGDGREARF